MALLTVQSPSGNTGAVLTANAVSASDTFVNDGNTIFIVRNRGAGASVVGVVPTTATATIPGRGAFTAPTISQSVSAGADAIFGPFDVSQYNGTGGVLTVTFATTLTNVTVTPISLTR